MLAGCGDGDVRAVSDDAGSDAGDSGPRGPAKIETTLDPSWHLARLTKPQTDALCQAFGAYREALPKEVQEYRCLARGVESGNLDAANDPVLTCNRFVSLCTPSVSAGGDGGLTTAAEATDCIAAMTLRRREVCADPTVAEFLACEYANAALEAPMVDKGKLTCEEALALTTLLPTGEVDCACGRPRRVGAAPADDADWDYVNDAVDACPASSIDENVAPDGCTLSQDLDGDHVRNEDDLCPHTEAKPVAVTKVGCSTLQDEDQDLVPDWSDACLGTAAGAALVSFGCSQAQDADGDGVPDSADFCPSTPPRSAMVSNGCTPSQGAPWAAPYLDVLPAGFVPQTVVGTAGGNPVNLRISSDPSTHTLTATGFDYKGTIYLDLPGAGFMELPNASVSFVGAGTPSTGITGSVGFPFPTVGFLAGLNVTPPAACALGFGDSSDPALAALHAPFPAGRFYLYVTCGAGFHAQLGVATLGQGASTAMTLVVDNTDPAVFFRGDARGLGPFGALAQSTVAFSTRGALSFTPTRTNARTPEIAPFLGHLFANGKAPLTSKLPLDVARLDLDGAVIADLNAGHAGVSFGAAGSDVTFGLDGTAAMDVDFSRDARLRMTLTNASLVGRLIGRSRDVTAAGEIAPGDLTLPSIVPLDFRAPLQSLVHVTDARDPTGKDLSWFSADADVTFHASRLPVPYILPAFGDVDLHGTLEVDGRRAHLTGTLDAAPHPYIVAKGKVSLEADIVWADRTFVVRLQGPMAFTPPPPASAVVASEIVIGSDDILVDGKSITP